ncbi:F0F1 ATP synthase subunit delta [Cobetia amphilecti]|jgi:F-type H+-transporting ATPase subunit b|uniref:ATP synthase subunit b n=1 Tax=Cobetia amphilecti TaxID=1055104 RepID=A0ABT6UTZ0_9GAMM|nr:MULTISPECIES: F0F1 ATP synthase subunit delta [Cobetia]MBR9799251.1 hypothetical protein [Gammaproteobacteria bacterium]MDI5885002.1 F0F1 ATP synthase subunit delta [Cobetia amphilecti]WOI24819.1 F0F1 ATP synthase subunit delta [Cobetia amphilecti]BBO56697.1 ATP synthase subunit b [Cobetia sp. AM6]|tara:strand:+ start:4179 stop:4916 length:738 start_codon:yes stop_codon:yes gene_type:complete
MTIDWWGIGLQALNVLILTWLLSRVLWRPIVNAIEQRRAAIQAELETASATQTRAEALLAEVEQTRAQLMAECGSIREARLSEAAASADALLSSAHQQVERLQQQAQSQITQQRHQARQQDVRDATTLAVDIATRLLKQLNGQSLDEAFRTRLLDSLASMSATQREALVTTQEPIHVVSVATLPLHEQHALRDAIADTLGQQARIAFECDPEMIAGLELRSAHFVLHNSWRADLRSVDREMQDVI